MLILKGTDASGNVFTIGSAVDIQLSGDVTGIGIAGSPIQTTLSKNIGNQLGVWNLNFLESSLSSNREIIGFNYTCNVNSSVGVTLFNTLKNPNDSQDDLSINYVQTLGQNSFFNFARGSVNLFDIKTDSINVYNKKIINVSDGTSTLDAINYGQFLLASLKENNLSDLTNIPTARSNLGLTNIATQSVSSNSMLFGGSGNTFQSLSAPTASNRLLISNANALPNWSNFSFPSSTTQNRLLFSSSNNVISELASANNSILITSSVGVPSISSVLPSAVQNNITSVGTVTSGTWRATAVDVDKGGTGVTSFVARRIIASGATSTGDLINLDPGLAGQYLMSNGSSLYPTWSSLNFVSSVDISAGTGISVSGSPITSSGTITISVSNVPVSSLIGVSANTVLCTLGDNSVGYVPSVVNGVLTTSSVGVPSIQTSLPTLVQDNITRLGNISSGTWNASTISVSRGGTGRTSFTTRRIVVSGTTTTGILSFLASGNDGQFLRSYGSASYPGWVDFPGVTSVSVTGDSGVTVTGSPITSSGTINISLSGIPANSLANYPSDFSLFLNGAGSWSKPYINDLLIGGDVSLNNYDLTTVTDIFCKNIKANGVSSISFNVPIYYTSSSLESAGIQLNNSNSSSYSNSIIFSELGVNKFSVGFNNSTNEGYLWTLTTAETIKIGTNNTTRMLIQGNGIMKYYGQIDVSGALSSNMIGSNGNTWIEFLNPINIGYSASVFYSSYGFLNSNGNTGTGSGTNFYSLLASSRIRASEFNAVSSINVKNIIERNEIIYEEALDIFKQIDFVKYEYKDKIVDGNGYFYGVIAEEIKEILPYYVSEDMSYIPNILEEIEPIKVHDGLYKVNFKNNFDFKVKDMIKLINKDSESHCQINDIQDDFIFIKTDSVLNDKVFAYGSYSNCPSVSKNKLFELSMLVIKNILTRLEKLESIN